jgi:hypothetical protein
MSDKELPKTESYEETREEVFERLRKLKRAYDSSYDFVRRIDDALDFITTPENIEKIKMPGPPNLRCAQHLVFGDDGKIIAEVDGMIMHDDFVLGVKMCTWLYIEEIDNHMKHLETLSEIAARDNEVRRFRGCVSGAILSEPAKKYAQEQGLYVLEVVGNELKLDVPEGFNARVWYKAPTPRPGPTSIR